MILFPLKSHHWKQEDHIKEAVFMNFKTVDLTSYLIMGKEQKKMDSFLKVLNFQT